MNNKPAICLTFDLEEFDLPLEFKQEISPEKQFEVTCSGMALLLPLLEKFNVSSTFFTTANFAQNNKELVKKLVQRHEIASHSFFHSAFETGDLKRSKDLLEEITGSKVTGFRMPRMHAVDHAELLKAGYSYDSSLHPTWIPGRYNHFSKPKTIFRERGLLIFPASVTPLFRSPLFWLSFKNFSSGKYCRWTQKCLSAYGYVNIYLHPWEFADLSAYKLPGYIGKNREVMIKKLETFLSHFNGKADFISIQTLLQSKHEL